MLAASPEVRHRRSRRESRWRSGYGDSPDKLACCQMTAISHLPPPSYVKLAERHCSPCLSGLLEDVLNLASVRRKHVQLLDNVARLDVRASVCIMVSKVETIGRMEEEMLEE